MKYLSTSPSLPLVSTLFMAIAFLLLGNLFATGMDAVVKMFSTSSGIYQYLFLRQLLITICLLPFFLRQPLEVRILRRGKIQAVRANITVIGGACVFIAVTELTLATANVLFYASPVITLLLAAWWFKEKLHKDRIFNIVCCFIGVIIALRPDTAGLGILAGLGAALSIACHNLLVRFIPKSTSSISVMFWGTALSLPLITLLSVFDWQPINSEMLYLVVGSACCIFGHQMCCIIAYRKAEAGAIAIAEYSGLIFAALLGWWVFSEALDVWTMTGMVFIVAPIILQSFWEHRRAKTLNMEQLRP